MSYKDFIIDNNGSIIGIFSLVLSIRAFTKWKDRKIGFVLLVISLALLFLAFISKRKKKNQKTWKIVVIALAALIVFGISLWDFDKTCPYVSLTDKSFEMDRMDKALLYDDTTKEFPIWFKKDDPEYNQLQFMVNNTGTTYADIIDAQFIFDDYKPITSKDILLLEKWRKKKPYTGIPPTAKASIDLSNITYGQSKYIVDFQEYENNDNGIVRNLREGQTFNVDPTSQTELIIFPKLNKSGVYTYHLRIDFEYDRKEYPMETDAVSFIYIDDDLNNYEYNHDKLDSLELDCEYYNVEHNKYIYYAISGRTLRVHDTEFIYSENDLERYLPFIDTIIIEEGTKRIEKNAFYFKPDSKDNKTLYLPKSLEYFDKNSFDKTYFNKIYYAGTKEQWNSLTKNLDDDSSENSNIEDRIYYEY